MFATRSTLTLLAALLGLALVSPAQAQSIKTPRQSTGTAAVATSKVIDGITYYYDANGDPLYYDDPVHYSPPKRFYWRNGGWVAGSTGHHSGHRGAIRSRGVRPIIVPKQTDAAGHPATNPPHIDAPAAKAPATAKPAAVAPRGDKRPALFRTPARIEKPALAPAHAKQAAPSARPSGKQAAPSRGDTSRSAKPAAGPAKSGGKGHVGRRGK